MNRVTHDALGSESGWLTRARHHRARRALERQLEYQTNKAKLANLDEDELFRSNFVRSQNLRRRLEKIDAINSSSRVLEVGSGAHGLIFGFGACLGVGIDPLAVHYKDLFPKFQNSAATVAAYGESLPFADEAFDVVLSDNVIDHAERPLAIVDEMLRVLKPGGILYFTVNVHHWFYDIASKLHGAWNAAGLKLELSAFTDHTVHMTKAGISNYFRATGLTIVEERDSVRETTAEQRRAKSFNADSLLKKLFFKNAIFELIAVKK